MGLRGSGRCPTRQVVSRLGVVRRWHENGIEMLATKALCRQCFFISLPSSYRPGPQGQPVWPWWGVISSGRLGGDVRSRDSEHSGGFLMLAVGLSRCQQEIQTAPLEFPWAGWGVISVGAVEMRLRAGSCLICRIGAVALLFAMAWWAAALNDIMRSP